MMKTALQEGGTGPRERLALETTLFKERLFLKKLATLAYLYAMESQACH